VLALSETHVLRSDSYENSSEKGRPENRSNCTSDIPKGGKE